VWRRPRPRRGRACGRRAARDRARPRGRRGLRDRERRGGLLRVRLELRERHHRRHHSFFAVVRRDHGRARRGRRCRRRRARCRPREGASRHLDAGIDAEPGERRLAFGDDEVPAPDHRADLTIGGDHQHVGDEIHRLERPGSDHRAGHSARRRQARSHPRQRRVEAVEDEPLVAFNRVEPLIRRRGLEVAEREPRAELGDLLVDPCARLGVEERSSRRPGRTGAAYAGKGAGCQGSRRRDRRRRAPSCRATRARERSRVGPTARGRGLRRARRRDRPAPRRRGAGRARPPPRTRRCSLGSCRNGGRAGRSPRARSSARVRRGRGRRWL